MNDEADPVRNLIKFAAGVAVATFVVLRLFIPGGLISDGSEAVSFAAVAAFLYDKVLWQWVPLEKTPRLAKRYKCTISYSHEKGSGHKQSSVVVKQSLTSIWLSFETDEVFTYSSSAELVEDGGMYYLQYIYKTEPKAAIAEANPSQFGACRLRVECSEGLLPKATKLLGTYWTNRKTMGDIVFSTTVPRGRHVDSRPYV